MLYEPSRHEALCGEPWDEARARAAIKTIAADAASAFDPHNLWALHPLDYFHPTRGSSYKCLYVGATGVIWALRYLAAAGAIEATRDWPADMERVHRAYLEAPETVAVIPSYLEGEAGILLVWWRLRPSKALADRLHALIRENTSSMANDFMLGTPGTSLAALLLHEWTGEERWRELFIDGVERIWSEWKHEPTYSCWLWQQQLFGQTGIHIGAVHGFTGNTYPLLRGAHLLAEERRAELYRRCAETLKRTAVSDADTVNWPQSVVLHRAGRTALLVQWCHGAAGVVGSQRYFPVGHDSQVDALLVCGGELVWRAGPLVKGPGLCHGTAGNGYAFLELHRRTGDAVWLDRARAFAMHAIGQYERMHAHHGHGRYSLWTGDPGVAVYLWDCIRGAGGFPSMDVL